MGPLTEKLVNALDECELFLRRYSEERWANWLEQVSSSLRKGNIGGIYKLESAFGGMGSISDLLIHPINGHQIDESEVEKCNKKLRVSLSKIYDLAQKVKKNAIFD